MSISSRFRQEFIERSVKAPIVWPREMKILNALIAKYPKNEFWANLRLNFDVNSLAWLKTDDGKRFLEDKWKRFSFEPNHQEKFDFNRPADIIKDFNIQKESDSKKIKTLKDFLNLK
jgi:hypothetical protein